MLLAMSVRLADLSIGDAAVVDGVEGGGAMAVRLLEMGFVPGTTVRLVKDRKSVV